MDGIRQSGKLCQLAKRKWPHTWLGGASHGESEVDPRAELSLPRTSKDYKYNKPGLETTFYDAKCVEVIDPFSNRIRFNERITKEDA